ncbi:MAG TPA: heme lyase CcmF/NrfE family subunit [Myxococcota bacterium]|nr:heme lyase CcmF/NrfE family subunit [Myxococcota bacterium]
MSDLGSHALRLALMVAILGIASGVYAGVIAQRQRRIGGVLPTEAAAWGRVAERSVWLCFAFVSLAMLSLFHALATFEFQLRYVAEHTARSMALHYRLAALWGGQAGSLLLWLWMLTAYASACVWFQRRASRSLMPWVVAALMANASFFLVLVNFVTNPFTRLAPGEVLSDGAGLNPLLQHPVMMIHPLMLYTGFTGFAVPFAFAFAALVTGELGTAWFRTTRRWTLFPWFFLSIGILLGGRWAYEVLGWGGYWAWDPVENASLMPWLAGTAYLHSVMIQEKRDMLKLWNLVLIGLTYSLCLFGTFLTRSGVVSSVHSFTAAGWFGYIFLGYVLAIAAAYFGTVFYRRDALRSTNRLESVVSREASFLLNNWLFLGILTFVFCGTLFPVVSEAVSGVKMSVGPAFFNSLIGPLALGLLFLTGVGPLIAWRKASLASVRRQFLWPATAGLTAAAALGVAFRGSIHPYSFLAWTFGAFVTGTVLQEYVRAIRARMRNGEGPVAAFASLLRKNQRRYGGYIVHLGVVFIFLGIAGAAFNEERLETIAPGGEIRLHDYRLRYLTAKALPKQHYGGAVARLALYQDDRPLAVMAPERRMYWLEQQPASIPSIHSTLSEDLYVILTAVEPDGSATVKVYRNPLVNWIWIGGYTFVLGTLAILWPHPPRTGESSGA